MINTFKASTAAAMNSAKLTAIGKRKIANRGWDMEIYPIGDTGYALATEFARTGSHINVVFMNAGGKWEMVGDLFQLCCVVRGKANFAYVDLALTNDASVIGPWVTKQAARFAKRNAPKDLSKVNMAAWDVK